MTGDTTKIFNAIDTVEEPEVKALRERLIERVRNAVKGGAPVDQIPGLHLSYVEQAQTVSNCFYVLSVGLILQGTKNLVIGDKSYRYGTGSMIVTSVDMPTSYELVGVKPSNPFDPYNSSAGNIKFSFSSISISLRVASSFSSIFFRILTRSAINSETRLSIFSI